MLKLVLLFLPQCFLREAQPDTHASLLFLFFFSLLTDTPFKTVPDDRSFLYFRVKTKTMCAVDRQIQETPQRARRTNSIRLYMHAKKRDAQDIRLPLLALALAALAGFGLGLAACGLGGGVIVIFKGFVQQLKVVID